MAKRKRKAQQKPVEQGVSPISGTAPPAQHQFKPGESGNPNGRAKSAGTSIREWINVFSHQELCENDLRKIGRDKSSPWSKRTAAERMLRTLEAGDISDFSGLLKGENNLEDLRGMGINTEVVKKLKQKTRVVPKGDGKVEEVIEREIELHDRAGNDFDRIMDRTEGKPKQGVEVTGRDGAPIQSEVKHKVAFDYDSFTQKFDHFAGRNGSATATPNGN